MVFRTPSFVRSEIEKTDRAIRQAGYTGDTHFRPPFGKKLVVLPYILKQQERANIFWDLAPDSLPELASDPSLMVDHVVSQAGPGSIILMHVMYASREKSLQALPGIIEGLLERGLNFVTLSELLNSGKPVQGLLASKC